MKRLLEANFGTEPATEIIPINPTVGRASTYLMKYILKSTNASGCSASTDLATTAERTDAHRATWGGRGIQFFDVPGSSTLWDEVRRIKANSAVYAKLTPNGLALQAAATGNDYNRFLQLLVTLRRAGGKDDYRIWYGDGEGQRHIQGVTLDAVPVNTHCTVWALVSGLPSIGPKVTVEGRVDSRPDDDLSANMRTVMHSDPRNTEALDLRAHRPSRRTQSTPAAGNGAAATGSNDNPTAGDGAAATGSNGNPAAGNGAAATGSNGNPAAGNGAGATGSNGKPTAGGGVPTTRSNGKPTAGGGVATTRSNGKPTAGDGAATSDSRAEYAAATASWAESRFHVSGPDRPDFLRYYLAELTTSRPVRCSEYPLNTKGRS